MTALTRSDSSSSLPEGVRKAAVDYSDHNSLIEALKGQDFLIITLNSSPEAYSAHAGLVTAAAAAGVQYVMPNLYGPDLLDDSVLYKETGLGFMVDKFMGQIKDAGLRSIVLNCGYWYEWSLSGGSNTFGFDIAKRTFRRYGKGAVVQNTSTWAQCGRAVAALLSLPIKAGGTDEEATLDHFADKGRVYVSSFRVSQVDMFESLKRVTGTTDSDWTIGEENPRERWQDGVDTWAEGEYLGLVKSMYTPVFFEEAHGDFESTRGLDNKVLKLSAEDLDEMTKLAVEMVDNGEARNY